MKICHVNLASGYHGGENQTLQLIKQQIELGYDLTVVANPKSPFAAAVQQLNCKVLLVKHYLRGHHRAITSDCQLIHVHEGRAIYWAWLQSLMFGIPYIVTRRIDNKLKKKWLANQAYGKASAAVGLSSEIVRCIKDAYPQTATYKIPSSPVTYPVDDQQLQCIRQQFDDKFLVIHAANMLNHKGFDISIAAARLLEKTHPEIQFALLGDGKERSQLEQQAQGLSNLKFMGKQSNMGTWFAAANMQIHPSYTEGLGSVILEGLNAGLPIVATNTGGIPDIIEDRVSGLLVKPGAPQALADAIIELKSNDELRQRCIDGAQEKLKGFRIEHTATLYESLYNEITNHE